MVGRLCFCGSPRWSGWGDPSSVSRTSGMAVSGWGALPSAGLATHSFFFATIPAVVTSLSAPAATLVRVVICHRPRPGVGCRLCCCLPVLCCFRMEFPFFDSPDQMADAPYLLPWKVDTDLGYHDMIESV
jgi:hypothetical protein